MHRIVIFGNSGSGKSTLAKQLASKYQLAHMDLDTIAWLDTSPPSRRPLAESTGSIDHFTQQHKQWVIEGCYANLLSHAMKTSNEIFF